MLAESDKRPENSTIKQDYNKILENLVRLTKKVGGEGFGDVQDSEVSELILPDE